MYTFHNIQNYATDVPMYFLKMKIEQVDDNMLFEFLLS